MRAKARPTSCSNSRVQLIGKEMKYTSCSKTRNKEKNQRVALPVNDLHRKDRDNQSVCRRYIHNMKKKTSVRSLVNHARILEVSCGGLAARISHSTRERNMGESRCTPITL